MNLFLAFAALVAGFVIPQLVIGLTIAAMGTSMPEAAVSITSALKGRLRSPFFEWHLLRRLSFRR